MDAHEKQNRVDEFEKLCRQNGIPCTIQRRAILEAVLDRDDHPTVARVFEDVRAANRGISKATVHRNLDVMAGMGVITKTCHPGNVARYDARTDIHHHLICLRCESVVDIDDQTLNSLIIPDTSASGFEVTDFRVQLRGVCKRCRDRERKKRTRK
jgi:Fur family peroxide stress response transcriptional regulator